MMLVSQMHLLVPKPDDGISRAKDWAQAGALIRAHFTHPFQPNARRISGRPGLRQAVST
jgi:hypothetical protein